jgi:indolepyruvate ferredoxin oxidoreductase alpha subunit
VSRELLSGNEAIAQGAWEAGVAVGVGYPGTPSTEILERFGKLPGTYAEWAPNEKVALETAIGVSMAGRRALFTAKHVGINVAADPFMTAAYTGVNAGLVMVAADDPGMYSSQNEQDSRNYAAFARVPMLEPSTSQEAIDFTRRAFEVSEEFDTVAMVRTCVRIAHTKSMAETGEQRVPEARPYVKDPRKWVMMPANAKPRRKVVDRRTAALVEFAETCDLTREELRDASVGIVCSGSVYQHVREALPEASTLKLGLSWPLPPKRLAAFAEKVDRLYVVEEVCDYYRTQLRALGLPVLDTPNPLPPDGELTPGLVRAAFGLENPAHAPLPEGLPPRPPALCAGCPHRLVYAELRRLKATVLGDIGCYTLGALPPLSALDSTVDMGASISMAHGFELARSMGETRAEDRPVVAVIGDSTFAHSGITSLLTISYNQGAGTICILDNRTTAMTGQQGNPVNGITLQGRPSRELDLAELCRALGIDDVREVDSMDMRAVRGALEEATSAATLSVIVFRSPCVLVHRTRKPALSVDSEACRACGICVSLGCPALGKDAGSGKAHIDPALCIGCGQCPQYCPFDAIRPGDDAKGGTR